MCGCLSCTPYQGPGPTTQACALTGNQTSDPLVHMLALSIEPHQSGLLPFFEIVFTLSDLLS